MNGQIQFQRLLSERLADLKVRNPRYSLRAFAGKLRVSPGALSGILSGKRKISRELAHRVARNLALGPHELDGLLAAFDAKSSPPSPDYARISADQFKVIADWWHYGILSLLNTRSFREDPSWIARRLRIPAREAEAALERLLRLGMLERAPDGSLKRSKPRFETTDGVADASLRQFHAQELELAKRSLEEDPVEIRDITSMTVAIDPAKIEEARKAIRDFQDRICALVGTEPRTEVYKLCVQFFPITGEDS
jgi:uncharacterized protein (TIGR02147 family)